MKLIAFEIRNYRSIVNSGRCYLSPDYITALIGQNESGKTSVLEALRSFYEGVITDDVLRSDLSFPEIICTFSIDNNKELGDYLDVSKLPVELHTVVSIKKEVSLRRKWINSRKSYIAIAEEEIVEFFNELDYNKLTNTNKIIASINNFNAQLESTTQQINSFEQKVISARNQTNDIFFNCEELRKKIKKTKIPDIRITAEQDLANAEKDLSDSERDLKEYLAELDQKKSKMQEIAEVLNTYKSFYELSNKVQALEDELSKISNQVQQTEHEYELCKTEKQIKRVSKNLESFRNSYSLLSNDLKDKKQLLSIQLKTSTRILEGKRLKEAESDALKEFELERSYATLEELGMSVFNQIPVFEFFEDFGSLLPNKIDLYDLLNDNINAEGYKAARNFLSIAGLNADFFREKNNRILKQKIENLNTEITIDFQDYWRQSVGHDDKIRINFELEHYDNSHPEKSGQPYLEFWVKDKQERLYPKQRSRGVRWFLSFYLELKAAAKEKKGDRVMLIDEPGLSLHARAQEDVLKVFEDLRENLQIIYCTHSPNLIDLKKLYRIIAVQRARDTDEKSETLILDSRSLNEASSDTLSPIYSLMGIKMEERQFIFPKNNIIVEDSVTFHYLDAIAKMYQLHYPLHFIPSVGLETVSLMANMFLGWNIDFGILLMDHPENIQLIEKIRANFFCTLSESSEKKFSIIKGFKTIEDMFSTIDFKRFILQQRIGITVKNSEYIENNKLSRIILVNDFCSKVQKEKLQFKDFDEETRKNFENLFSAITAISVKELI